MSPPGMFQCLLGLNTLPQDARNSDVVHHPSAISPASDASLQPWHTTLQDQIPDSKDTHILSVSSSPSDKEFVHLRTVDVIERVIDAHLQLHSSHALHEEGEPGRSPAPQCLQARHSVEHSAAQRGRPLQALPVRVHSPSALQLGGCGDPCVQMLPCPTCRGRTYSL